FSLFFDTFQDRNAAFCELAQILCAVSHVAKLNFIEAAGGLFAIPGDERECVSFVEERECSSDLLGRERELSGDRGNQLRLRHRSGMGGGMERRPAARSAEGRRSQQ